MTFKFGKNSTNL